MTPSDLTLLEALTDPRFVETDVRLREGGHIDDRDIDLFSFLDDARPHLEAFYDRYGCDLIRSVERYYYLLPRGAAFGQAKLSAGEMLVGQVACLLRLDPTSLRTAMRVPRARVVELLDQLLGQDRIGHALNPKRKRTAAVGADLIRKEIDLALKTLARLGFVDLEGDDLRLRAPLTRFLEPLPDGDQAPRQLEELIAEGTLDPPDGEPPDDDPEGAS